MGALVTVSTASTAEETESVISFTSSRIWSTRMISRFAASTVSDTRSTSGSTFAATGSSEAVMRSTLASVGSTCFWTSSAHGHDQLYDEPDERRTDEHVDDGQRYADDFADIHGNAS